ncbi:helix-turn-helix transcriptional regulator [Methanolobus chelungpuianus]|uniref:Transcriptional regulator n=1 Tax=Methanolobus chelungpuianus TaxID=502115 RepID=A0AAE3KY95_9EURY|nr:winged helix-turn-helix domain-containing protein [Methanolobus chelungpuianus]MCQ6963546.1 transcriptional regulator [Methanolobus chelungpuianus]
MKKPLLDVIFMSDKRKSTLLLLQDGAREMEDLLTSLKTNRQSLLPQIRVLEEHNLVSHEKDVYELTPIGKSIVDKMAPLVHTTEALDVDIDYWGTHDISFIPPGLLERMDELTPCAIMSPSTEKIYEAHYEFNQMTKQQKFQFSITSFFYPNFPVIFEELLSSGVEMHVIVSQSLFDKLKADSYEDIHKIISHKLTKFYVYPKKMNFLAFVFNEASVMISPLKSTGEFDNRHVLCKSPGAVRWAKEFSEHYLKMSVQITEI